MTQPPTTEDLLASLNKQLPYDDETEQAILSCLLQRPSLCDEAPHPEILYHDANRIILTTIVALFAYGKPIDQISLTHALRNANKLDVVGGPAFISELFTLVPTTSNYQYYLTIVRDKFQVRQMIGALAAGIAHLQAFTGAEEVSVTDALQHVTKLVCEAVNDDGASEIEFKPIGELMLDVVDAIEERVANPGKLPGVSTGFSKLDEYTGGLEKGTLTVIAGKPSDGKSIVARQICENVCMDGHAASIFSVEMTPLQECSRILCSQAGVDAQSMKLGMLTRGELDSIGAKMPRISKWDMQVFDAASCSIEQICRNISRRAKKLKPNQKLVAEIDYIQICKTSVTDIGNREQEVSHIAKTAKLCAKMTGAAIIFPCQLNKQGEARESEAIEQHADNFWVIMDHEDEDAPKKKAWEKAEKKDVSDADLVDLFLKKVRNGIRRVKVPFRRMGRFFRFEPHAHEK
jgi:replicative DNA helicase